jgi:hypothetical protein
VFVRGVRLVDVHHHGPLEVGDGAGYCVQTLAGQWRKLSPSAELMVDLKCGARCAIRYTEAGREDCYDWTVTRWAKTCHWRRAHWRACRGARRQRRRLRGSRTGAACRAMEAVIMADRPLAPLFWRVLDGLYYWLTLAKLWVAAAR